MNFFRAVIIFSVLFSFGCSLSPERADVYSADEVGTPMRVEYATVVALRPVKIRLEQPEGVGSATGAVIGGVLGSGVSDNSRAAAVGTVVGAVVGGTLGKTIAKDAGMTEGWEITYRLPSGVTRLVIQPRAGLEQLRVGQRIRIIHTPEGLRISPVSEGG